MYGFTDRIARNLTRSGQERRARAYRTAVRVLIRFNKGRDISLKHINSSPIKEFETNLKSCGKAMNTISYYMSMLRAIDCGKQSKINKSMHGMKTPSMAS